MENKKAVVDIQTPYAIFDLDGTLIDSNKSAFEDLVNLYQSYGKEPDYAFIQTAKTKDLKWICRRFSEIIGQRDKADAIEQHLINNSQASYQTVPLKPHVTELLEACKSSGIKTCVASATDHSMIDAVLTRLQIRDYFDFLMSVKEVNHVGKDRPDLFIACASRYKETDFGKFTVFEDSLEAMQTAGNLGMKVIGIYDELWKEEIEEMKKSCDRFLYDFKELVPSKQHKTQGE